jgi:hypothetical protein
VLWGLPPSVPYPAWAAAVQTSGTKNILGFNEPDLTYSGTSNILPANAAVGYKAYMEPYAGSSKIGMPNELWKNVGSSSGGNYCVQLGAVDAVLRGDLHELSHRLRSHPLPPRLQPCQWPERSRLVHR